MTWASQDKKRQEKIKQEKSSQDKTRQDKIRQDKTRQDKTRQDMTWASRDKANPGHIKDVTKIKHSNLTKDHELG